MPPRNVLLATDLDSRTDRAMDRAAALAVLWRTRLVIAHAIEGSAGGWSRARPKDPRSAAIRQIQLDLRAPTPNELELVVERHDAVKLVLETVERLACELVVTGAARPSGFGLASAGATVDALARLSPVPVLVVKRRPNHPYRDVVVATDFSEPSRAALLVALGMFPLANVSLVHAYHVPYESFADDKQAAREVCARHTDEKLREFLAATPVGDRRVQVRSKHGQPEQALSELVADGGVDLIVVGTGGRGLIGQLLLGSVARSIVGEVPADVLVASNRAMAASPERNGSSH